MHPALYFLLVPALLAILAFVVWHFVLRSGERSIFTDGERRDYGDEHETLARSPALVFGPSYQADLEECRSKARDLANGGPRGQLIPDARARRELGIPDDAPVPRTMVFGHSDQLPPVSAPTFGKPLGVVIMNDRMPIAEFECEAVPSDTPGVLTLKPLENATMQLAVRETMGDGYDYRAGRDVPPLHTEGL